MSLVEKILQNNLLVFAVIGAGIYIVFYTEVGEVVRCGLNPAKCVGDAAKIAGKKISDAAKDVTHDMKKGFTDVTEKPKVVVTEDRKSKTVHTKGGMTVHKVGQSSARVDKETNPIKKAANFAACLTSGRC